MDTSHGDLSLFSKRECGKSVGIWGAYVDDLLRAGDMQFRQDSTKASSSSLETKPAENPSHFHWIGNVRTTDRATAKLRALCETVAISQETHPVRRLPLLACQVSMGSSFWTRHRLCSIYVHSSTTVKVFSHRDLQREKNRQAPSPNTASTTLLSQA